MRTYIYKVSDIHNINPKVYYFKRKYKANAFVERQEILRQEEINRIAIRQDIILLNSEYACYRLTETIRTED